MTQEGGDISLALLEALLDQSWVSDSTAPRSSRGNQKKKDILFHSVVSHSLSCFLNEAPSGNAVSRWSWTRGGL